MSTVATTTPLPSPVSVSTNSTLSMSPATPRGSYRLPFTSSVMSALATILVGTGQDSGLFPLLAVVISSISFLLTDVLKWVSLNRVLASVVGIVAVGFTYLESSSGSVETQFLSVSRLLIYLQFILQFQQKDARKYWQLIVLGLLQVVVAAALNLFFLFAPLLVLYIIFAVLTMLLLFAMGETEPFFSLGDAESTTSPTFDALARGESIHVGGASHPQPRSDFSQKLIWRFARPMLFHTALVAAIVFFLVPRLSNESWKASGGSRTGYSEEGMDLSSSDSISESPAVVFRASLVDEWNHQPYLLGMDPYFRGGVLGAYRDGKWLRSGDEQQFRNLDRPERLAGVVRQNISMERRLGRVVFSVSPTFSLDGSPRRVRVNQSTNELVYDPKDDEILTEYTLGTTGFRNGIQSEYLAAAPGDEMSNLRFNARRLEDVAKYASDVVQQSSVDTANSLATARLFESHFAASGLYKYSLDPSPNRSTDPNIDPVVDFLTNHRTGHCQYFASAATLCLRSLGIPARVVIGYHGGDYNAVGNYYQVREMDAHAWVEVLVPAEQVPADEIKPTDGIEGNAWIRIDPTPGSNTPTNLAKLSPWRTKLNDGIDYLQLLWTEYVLGLNESRQRRAIYEPIQRFFLAFSQSLFNPAEWAARWEAFRSRFQGGPFNSQAIFDIASITLLLTIVFYLFRWLVPIVFRGVRFSWQRIARSRRSSVDFYRRFETLLARQGFRRDPHQTPREFAQEIQAKIAQVPISELTSDPKLKLKDLDAESDLPAKIVDLLYAVRFGNESLDAHQQLQIERWLQSLQSVLPFVRTHAKHLSR